MSLEKAELKILILNDLGCDIEDMSESLQRECHQQEGATVALREATKAILGLQALVDEDVDKGRYDIEAAARVKAYVARAASQCEDMSKAAFTKRMVSEGRHQGVAQVVGLLKKKAQVESLKAEAMKSTDEDRRPIGGHPGPSIAQSRKAAEGATKKKTTKKRAPRKKRTRTSGTDA